MDLTQVKNYVLQASTLKAQIDDLSKLHSEIKSQLTEAIDEYGETDGRGHVVLELEVEVNGIRSISKQRRVSTSIDTDAAESILTKKELYEKCVRMEPMLDEDAIMAAYYKGELTEEDIDTMFPKKVSYAFLMNKG